MLLCMYTGAFACIDGATGHFRAYPCIKKSEAPIAAGRYYRDAGRDGVKIKVGAIFFTDNERIFTSAKMHDVVEGHDSILMHS